MPYLRIQTNCPVDDKTSDSIIQKASRLVSEQLGKPEQYVMVELNGGVAMSFASTLDPCAYLELKSINLPEDNTTQLSAALCEFIASEIQVTADRIYIEFANAERHLWGWNNKTF